MTASLRNQISASALLLSLAACDDPAGPDPAPVGPDTELRLERTVSYFADRPDLWQAGEYFYDAQGRLERFDYISTYTGEPVVTIRKQYLYRDDGRALGHDSFVYLDEAWHLSRTIRYEYEDGTPLPVEIELADIDEATGAVFTEVWQLDYDRHGQINEIRRGSSETVTLTYDSRGDAIRVRTVRDSGVFLERLTYTDAWNPYAALPPVHGAFSAILLPGDLSLHLAATVETGLEGQPPATEATATVETNSHGYPTRWELTFWSTNDPTNTSTAITEYTYHAP